MKKIINIVQVLLAVAPVFFSGILFADEVFAADNENVFLSGYDINQITTDGAGTTFVSDANGKSDFVTLNIPVITVPSSDSYGDAAYKMSFYDYSSGRLFVATGKKDDSDPSNILGGLELFDTADNSRIGAYGADGTTYRQVYSRDDGIIFLSYFDTSYQPYFEAVDYSGSSITGLSQVALYPSGTIADIIDLSISGNNAFVGMQDDGSGADGGYVNVIDISNPSGLDSVLPGTYATSDAVTAVVGNGSVFYVGHGNSFDVVDTNTLSQISTVDTGAQINNLATDGTYIYVANDTNGLRIYKISDLSLVAEYTSTAGEVTAVFVDGEYIYFAISDGSDSTIYKIKKVFITLSGDNPQTVELGAGYVELGATAGDGSTPVIDTSDFVDAIGSYSIVYTATDTEGNFGLSKTRTVNVVDTTAPIITLVAPNPQAVEVGSPYVELGAKTDDGSLVQIDASAADTSTVGSFNVIYDSVDASGNHATQVERTVNVVAVAYTINASAGAGGSISPTGAVVVEEGGNMSFTATPDAGYHILDVLVDGVSVGAISNYTFSNVLADGHTIDASFEVNPDTFTITASANPHGAISPSGEVIVASGGDQTFTFTADSGYRVVDVLVDDVSVGRVDTYTFFDVVANHTIRVNFGSSIIGGGSAGGGGGLSSSSEIPGCDGRTTGFSTITGESCAGNGEVLGAEKFIFTMFLKIGHSPYPTGVYANEVMELQKFLNAIPYNSGLAVDGKFGPLTKAAVIKFQLANGLVGDGLVGPLTRAVLNK